MLKNKVSWLQLMIVATSLLIVEVVSVPIMVHEMVGSITKQQQTDLTKLKQDTVALQKQIQTSQSANAVPSNVGTKEVQALSDMLKSGNTTTPQKEEVKSAEQVKPVDQAKTTETTMDANASPYGLILKADTTIYSKPYTTSTAVVKAALNEKMDILGKYDTKNTTNRYWYEVKLSSGKTGYVQESMIKANKTVELSKVVRSKGPTTNIRATASTTAKKAGVLSNKEFAKILEDGNWKKVQTLDGKIGYVLSTVVTVE